MRKVKKREIECPHLDCVFFSSENREVDGETVLITYCSHPNSDLVEDSKHCGFYRLNWAKQIKKIRKPDPSEKVRIQREALQKLLKHAVGHLSPEEKDASMGLIEHLKEQEERLVKLSKLLQKSGVEDDEHDPFTIPTESSSPKSSVIQDTGVDSQTPDFIATAIASAAQEMNQTKASSSGTMRKEPDSTEADIVPRQIEGPEAVVRDFIEAFNRQDFDREYNYLGNALRLTPRGDYVRSRKFAYASSAQHVTNGNLPTQEMGEVASVKIDGDNARIICDKIERFGPTPQYFQQRYVLRKEGDDWKIVQVQTRSR